MLERTGALLGAEEAVVHFDRFIHDFRAAAVKVLPEGAKNVSHAQLKSKDTALVQACLAAAERVDKKNFLLTIRSLAKEMRMSVGRTRRFLDAHPGLSSHLNLRRHPHGQPTCVPR